MTEFHTYDKRKSSSPTKTAKYYNAAKAAGLCISCQINTVGGQRTAYCYVCSKKQVVANRKSVVRTTFKEYGLTLSVLKTMLNEIGKLDVLTHNYKTEFLKLKVFVNDIQYKKDVETSLNSVQIKEIIKLRKAGASYKKLQTQFKAGFCKIEKVILEYAPELAKLPKFEFANSPRVFSKLDISEMIKLRKSGKSFYEISRIFKTCNKTIKNSILTNDPSLNKLKPKFMKSLHNISEKEVIASILKMKSDGYSIVSIAKTFKTSDYMISKILKENSQNVQASNISQEKIDHIKAMKEMGLNFLYIANKVKLSVYEVEKILRKL